MERDVLRLEAKPTATVQGFAIGGAEVSRAGTWRFERAVICGRPLGPSLISVPATTVSLGQVGYECNGLLRQPFGRGELLSGRYYSTQVGNG